VRATVGEDGIEVHWHTRYKFEGNKALSLDPQGDVVEEIPLVRVRYAEPWRAGGTIKFSDELVEISGVDDFDWFVHGLARHAVGLIVCGYGETVEEVIGWFEDVLAGQWIVPGTYRYVGPPRYPFEDLGRCLVRFPELPESKEDEDEDDILRGVIELEHGDRFDLGAPLAELILPVAISLIPTEN
jgi:hypothetical protein